MSIQSTAEQVSPASKPEVPIPLLLSGFWCVLGAVELFLALISPDGILRNGLLGLPARLSLLSLDLFLLGLLVVLVGTPLVLVLRSLRKPFSRTKLRYLIGHCLMDLAVWALVMCYAISWATYWTNGYFLDSGGVKFWLDNAVQFMQHISHMYPVASIVFPMLVLLGVVGVCDFFVPWLSARNQRFSRNVVWGAGLALGAFFIISLVGTVAATSAGDDVKDPNTGATYDKGTYYAYAQSYRTGPAARLFSEVCEVLTKSDLEPQNVNEIPVTIRPRVKPVDFVDRLSQEQKNKWNVIIILVESLRPDQLKAFGCQRDIMPNVNALARESRVFTNCYTQASHSDYADLCILTSLYPLRSNSYHRYVRNPSYPRCLIYDVLKELGYRTAIFSSQNEHWGNMHNYLDTGTLDRFLHSETFEGDTYVSHKDVGFARWVESSRKSGKIDDRFTVGEAIQWIGEVGEDPFCIYLNLQNSHVPFVRPRDFSPRFGPESVDFTIAFGDFPRDKVDIVKDVYADSLAYVDYQLGRLFDQLKARGLWDKTIVVLSGDTGQAFYEHGFAGHARELYNEVMRVPLVMRAPGLKPARDERLSQHVDVPPTVFSLLGIPSYPGFQGVNLLNREGGKRRSAYMVCQSPLAEQYAIVRNGWKLIYDARRRSYLLYNLKLDPKESLEQSSKSPEMLRHLRTRLHSWMRIQLDYYSDADRHIREFPPVLKE